MAIIYLDEENWEKLVKKINALAIKQMKKPLEIGEDEEIIEDDETLKDFYEMQLYTVEKEAEARLKGEKIEGWLVEEPGRQKVFFYDFYALLSYYLDKDIQKEFSPFLDYETLEKIAKEPSYDVDADINVEIDVKVGNFVDTHEAHDFIFKCIRDAEKYENLVEYLKPFFEGYDCFIIDLKDYEIFKSPEELALFIIKY